MPIPLGILAAAGARQAAGATFELLESTVLTSAQATVEFTNLTTKYAATYQHLQLRIVSRSLSPNEDYLYLRFNSDTGSNYRDHLLEGNGSAVNSYNGAQNQIFIAVHGSAALAANIYGSSVIDILDAFETTKNKTIRALGGQAPRSISLASGLS